jgi:REP element-mobilizing transposase RayT
VTVHLIGASVFVGHHAVWLVSPVSSSPVSRTTRRKRSGHFWQGRFGAVAMDEEHLAAALRYVSLNPVRAAG